MVKTVSKTIKGNKYIYIEKSVRIGGTVKKISKYLGNSEDILSKDIEKATLEVENIIIAKESEMRAEEFSKLEMEYPINREEIRKIEEMNLKYKEIMKRLNPNDLEDLNKRFIANYVFESNALEGNSLTLKNVGEIVFENRISQGKDLREIYDAQNSYDLFLYLQKSRQKITHRFIIKIHSMLMENIDSRLGYRNLPIVLLGKTIKLTKPEEVHTEMSELIEWHNQSKGVIYPLELALKFHAKFEKIHPFSDGNGRVGRFLLNYILIRAGYFPIIIRKTTRNTYIKSLEASDRGKYIPLIRFGLKWYKKTYRNFFEIYYKHIK